MRRLDSEDLRAIVSDPAELAKGVQVLDDGGLANLARHGDRLYADARGMMPAPYKTMVIVADRPGAAVTARCSCMAARTRPFCKHAAALLIAWSQSPEAFVEADKPPEGAGEPRRKRRPVKQGKLDDATLMGDAASRAIALVRELATTGVASIGEGRPDALHALAEGLRAGKLRRLAGRVHRLAELLESARLPAEEYADLLIDVLLTARKIEKHVAGEPLDPRHVEELIGKTWRKADRAPIEGLELIEFAARSFETPDGFVVREQRLVDVATATHYADKQIVPAFLARRTPARPSLAGKVARGAAGSVYPGYAPRRLELERRGDVRDLDAAALERLVAAALPGAAAALAAFQEHLRDLFAPETLPVTVRVAAIVTPGPTGGRLRAADATGEALHLPDDPLVEDQLGAALRGGELRAIVGDVRLDRALPVLVPRALVSSDGRLLRLLTAAEIAARPARRARARRGAIDVDPGDWAAQARAAGASSAAVSLAEVRGELADLLAQGVGSFTERAVEPLAARLRELHLERPAQLLAGIPARAEGERLEDVVRAYQVLGVALTRVVGTTTVDLAALVPVPLCASVRAPAPARWLDLDEAMHARAAGALDRWTALVHAGRALAAVPAAALLAAVHPWWSHAWLSPMVASAVAAEPGAVEVARAVLGDPARGRAARQTAILVLVTAGADDAARHVAQILGRGGDPALGAFALDAIDAAREGQGDPDAAAYRRERRQQVANLVRILGHGGAADDRARAAAALATVIDDAGAAALRQAWLGDPSDAVREAAAVALGQRCDADAIDSFTRALARRIHPPAVAEPVPPAWADDDRVARAAALGLGEAGDVRGVALLVEALAAGWKTATVAECLRRAGAIAMPALRAAVAGDPALAKRKTFKDLLAEP